MPSMASRGMVHVFASGGTGRAYRPAPCVRCGNTHTRSWPLCDECQGLVLAFTVYGAAKPRGSKIAGVSSKGKRFVRDSSKASYPWMADVRRAAADAWGERELLLGPLRVDLDFYQARPASHYGSGRNAERMKPSAPPRPIVAPDKGKLERGVIDAMQGIVYRNDSQIVEGDARKWYGVPERCEIRIAAL